VYATEARHVPQVLSHRSGSTSAAFHPEHSHHRPSRGSVAVSAQSLVPKEQKNPNTAASYNYSSGYGMSHEAAGQGHSGKSGDDFISLPQDSSMSVPVAAGGPPMFGSKGRYFSPNVQR